MKKRLHGSIPFLMIVPMLVIYLLFCVYPLIDSFYLSFNKWTMTSTQLPRFVWLRNYRSVFQDKRFWNSLRVTLVYTLGVVSAQMILGMLLALLMSRSSDTKFRRVCRSIILIPIMLTPVVVGLMWKFMFNPDLGIVNHLLSLFKIYGPVWLGDVKYALPAIMIVNIWQQTPFVFLILFAGMNSIDIEIYEAAANDGANGFQVFRYITLPLIVPFIVITCIFRFIDSIRVFDSIYIMTRGGPAITTETLSIYVYKVGLNFFDIGYASALSYIVLLIILLISTVFLRLWKE